MTRIVLIGKAISNRFFSPAILFTPTIVTKLDLQMNAPCGTEKEEYISNEIDERSAIFFDKDWYSEKYGIHFGNNEAALSHFLAVGQFKNYSPHPLLDPHFYHRRYPDVAESGLSAIFHFLKNGCFEGRMPNALFDTAWYVSQAAYTCTRSINPAFYYLLEGERKGHTPHLLFDSPYFRQRYRIEEFENALVHFLKYAMTRDLDPHPLFDISYYRFANKDVWSAGVEPVEHYLNYGGAEGRAPSKAFDGQYYNSKNPDVRSNRQNPLMHYLQYGDREGRSPHPHFDTKWYKSRWRDLLGDGQSALDHCMRERLNRKLQSHPSPEQSSRFHAMLDAQMPPSSTFSAAVAVDKSRAILMVNHSFGGGTQIYVNALSHSLTSEGHRVWQLRYHPKTPLIEVGDPSGAASGFKVDQQNDRDALITLLTRANLDLIHYNQLLGAHEVLRNLWAELKCRYVVTAHDFFWSCPRVTMIDASGRFCGSGSSQQCDRCVALSGPYPSLEDEWTNRQNTSAWRDGNREFLGRAVRVIAPSQDTADRLKSSLDINAVVKTHPFRSSPLRIAAPPSSGKIRIAVIGAIGQNKGFELLAQCIEEAHLRERDIEFIIIGEVCEPERIRHFQNVKILGSYPQTMGHDIISSGRYHAALFLSVWPETYSYTLTEALQSGLFPVALDIGAIGERIRENKWGHLIPFEARPPEINDALENVLKYRCPPPTNVFHGRQYRSYFHDYYAIQPDLASGTGL